MTPSCLLYFRVMISFCFFSVRESLCVLFLLNGGILLIYLTAESKIPPVFFSTEDGVFFQFIIFRITFFSFLFLMILPSARYIFCAFLQAWQLLSVWRMGSSSIGQDYFIILLRIGFKERMPFGSLPFPWISHSKRKKKQDFYFNTTKTYILHQSLYRMRFSNTLSVSQ